MLGSVFSQEIKSAFPFVWTWDAKDIIDGPYMWQPALFWMTLILFGYLFKHSISAQAEENREALGELRDNTERLETLIKTLPDEGFLTHFEDYCRMAAEETSRAIQPGSDKVDIEVAIVTCLAALGHLARLFDGHTGSFRYAIFVMVFKELPNDPDEKVKLRERLHFTEEIADMETWRGFLDSHLGFARVMDARGGSVQDDFARPFAMPVPLKEFRSDNDKPTVLPGAVEAFCYPERMVKLPDTMQLGTWFKNTSGFRPSLANEFDEYFTTGPGKEIRSLVSFPFGTSDSKSEEYKDEPFGVIVIHSNKVDILKGQGVKFFFPLTIPFRMMLGELFRRLPN
ncbi:hypothetical protein SAMN05216411_11842 [Nitrosospira multiformis]|nr:hypothetical protein SAMN05216411_11842 [Nitrosospira multiformis]